MEQIDELILILKCPTGGRAYQHHDAVVDVRRQVRNQLDVTVACPGSVMLEGPTAVPKLRADAQAEDYGGSCLKVRLR